MDVTGITSAGAANAQPETKTTAASSDTQFSAVLDAAAAGTSQSAKSYEVQYLDGDTGLTKTGYVFEDVLYADVGGTVVASEYSQFRKSDGLLYVQTPYGTIRTSDFAVLLQKQQQYDSQTFGQPVFDMEGNHVATSQGPGPFTDPLYSYTSAPGGPGTVSQEIWDQYYSEIAGSTPVTTVEEILAESAAADAETAESSYSGTGEQTTVLSAPAAGATVSDVAATDVSTTVATATYASAAVSAAAVSATAVSATTVAQTAQNPAGNTDAGAQQNVPAALLEAERSDLVTARLVANRKAQLQQYINTMLLENEL
jgi:hypothetical protein